MYCKECGNKLDDSIKFCPDCGAKVDQKEPAELNAKQVEYVSYESLQQKSVSDTEKLFSGLTKIFAGYGVIHTVVSLFLNHGFTQGGLRIIFLMFVIAAGSFAICSSIRKKSPITEHFKFKCTRCNEENIIPADAKTTFECKKCEKKFIVIENNIKTIV